MKAKLEIIGAMAAFGTIGAFVRHIPLPSGELALYRALIAAGAIFLWQLCTGRGLGRKDVKAEMQLQNPSFRGGIPLSRGCKGSSQLLFCPCHRDSGEPLPV